MSRLAAHVRAAVGPDRPEALISEGEFSRILDAAELLPSEFSEFFGFETVLSDPNPEVDFLACAKAEFGGREALAHGEFPGTFPPDHPWGRIRRFAQRWASPESPLYTTIDNLWMEFDLRRGREAGGVPSVFVGTTSIQGGSPPPPWLNVEVFPVLLGAPLDDRIWRRFAAFVENLPADSHVFQLGLMLSRGSPAIRACIRGLRSETAYETLRDLGAPGADADFDSGLRRLSAEWPEPDYQLDVGEALGERIGVECSLAPGPSFLAALEACLDGMVAREECTPDKASAILGWGRVSHEREAGAQWPPDLLLKSERRGPDAVSGFARWPYHVKYDFVPGRVTRAKGYLAVRHLWITREFIASHRRITKTEVHPVDRTSG